jgi:hypothetical protein
MIEQVSTSVKFLAFFTASKQGKTGLTVTIDVYNPSGTQIVTGGSATALGGGLYSYTLSTDNSSEGEYAAIFKTTDATVDSQHIPSLWVLGRAGVENLDAATSTRLASASYTAPSTPPTASAIASAVWAAADKTGYSLTSAERTAIATAVEASILNEADGQQILNAIVGAIGNSNVDQIALVAAIRSDLERAGGRLVNLDASVSSRLAPSGTLATVTTLTNAPTVPTAAAIADEVRVELATELARLDAPVSGATAPSAATVATAVRTELATELARVDQAISTRLAGSSYTAPANNDISAIKAKTDLLETTRLAQCSTVATTGAQLAAALS